MPKRHHSTKIPARITALLEDELLKENKWAYETFLPSILSQFTRKKSISDKQYQILVKIEEDYSDSNKKKILKSMDERQMELQNREQEWSKEYFGTEIEEKARIVAGYYRNESEKRGQKWFENIYESVLAGRLPSRRGCMTMISNSYSQRVLKAWNKEPDFPIKSIVQPRKKFKDDPNHPLYKIEFAFVMKVNVASPTATDGGKQYLILPKGDLKGIICEERHLKTYRRK